MISAGIIHNSGVSCRRQRTRCRPCRTGQSSCEVASAIASLSMNKSPRLRERATSTARDCDAHASATMWTSSTTVASSRCRGRHSISCMARMLRRGETAGYLLLLSSDEGASSPPPSRRRRAAGLGLPGGRRLVRGGLRAGLATGRRPSAAPRANRTATNPRTTPCRAPAEAWKRPVGAVASAEPHHKGRFVLCQRWCWKPGSRADTAGPRSAQGGHFPRIVVG